MIVWLYTEENSPLFDGPFYSLSGAQSSPLWCIERACCWLVHHEPAGWFYDHRFFNGIEWVSTSSGCRPYPPIPPADIALARRVTSHDIDRILAISDAL